MLKDPDNVENRKRGSGNGIVEDALKGRKRGAVLIIVLIVIAIAVFVFSGQ